MKKRTPPEIKVPGKFDPQIRLLIVYFVTTLVVLWVWQELVRQVAVVTISYSEFKGYVARHEVTEATIQQDEIVGRIVPRSPPETKAVEPSVKPAGTQPSVKSAGTQPGAKPAGTQPGAKPTATQPSAKPGETLQSVKPAESPVPAISPSPKSTPAPT